MTSLMRYSKKNGPNAQTLNFVESGCIATASLKMKMGSIFATSAKSYLPDLCCMIMIFHFHFT